jgi:hypothetical protein
LPGLSGAEFTWIDTFGSYFLEFCGVVIRKLIIRDLHFGEGKAERLKWRSDSWACHMFLEGFGSGLCHFPWGGVRTFLIGEYFESLVLENELNSRSEFEGFMGIGSNDLAMDISRAFTKCPTWKSWVRLGTVLLISSHPRNL